MKIEEANQELTKQLGPKYSTPHTDFHNAMKLGIEAMKFKQSWQKGQYFPPDYLLPGETKD